MAASGNERSSDTCGLAMAICPIRDTIRPLESVSARRGSGEAPNPDAPVDTTHANGYSSTSRRMSASHLGSNIIAVEQRATSCRTSSGASQKGLASEARSKVLRSHWSFATSILGSHHNKGAPESLRTSPRIQRRFRGSMRRIEPECSGDQPLPPVTAREVTSRHLLYSRHMYSLLANELP